MPHRLFFLFLSLMTGLMGCHTQTIDTEPSGQSLTDVAVSTDTELTKEEDTQPPLPLFRTQHAPPHT